MSRKSSQWRISGAFFLYLTPNPSSRGGCVKSVIFMSSSSFRAQREISEPLLVCCRGGFLATLEMTRMPWKWYFSHSLPGQVACGHACYRLFSYFCPAITPRRKDAEEAFLPVKYLCVLASPRTNQLLAINC